MTDKSLKEKNILLLQYLRTQSSGTFKSENSAFQNNLAGKLKAVIYSHFR